MTDQKPRWDAATTIAEDLLQIAPPQTPMALIVFTETVSDTIRFGQGRLAAMTRLGPLKNQTDPLLHRNRRRTAFYDAIMTGLAQLDPVQPGDVICAISDGGDNISKTTPSEVEKALQQAGVRLCASLFHGGASGLTIEESAGRASLHRIMETTGGNGIEFIDFDLSRGDYKQGAELFKTADHLLQRMVAFYRLEIRLPLAIEKPEGWKLEVVNETEKRRRGLLVSYPRHLFLCARTPNANQP
jgi:hypothetical protein